MANKYSFFVCAKNSYEPVRIACSFIDELEDTHSTETFNSKNYIFRQPDYTFIDEFFKKRFRFVDMCGQEVTKSDITDLFLACDEIIELYYKMSSVKIRTSKYNNFMLSQKLRTLTIINYDFFIEKSSAILPLRNYNLVDHSIFYAVNKDLSEIKEIECPYGFKEKRYEYGYFVDVSNVKKYLKKVLSAFENMKENERMVFTNTYVEDDKPKFTIFSYEENDTLNRDYK